MSTTYATPLHPPLYVHASLLEFGERLDLVLWETCHIYATCQAYRAEAEFQQSPLHLCSY